MTGQFESLTPQQAIEALRVKRFIEKQNIIARSRINAVKPNKQSYCEVLVREVTIRRIIYK